MGAFGPIPSGRWVVIHQGALGDFLLALPILDGLHRASPGIRIDIWAKSEHVALLSQKPYLGKARPPGDVELTPFFHDDLWKQAEPPPYLEESSAVLIFGQEGSRVLARRISQRLPCPVYWIQSFPAPGQAEHVYDFLLRQINRLGWTIPACLPEIHPADQEKDLARALLRRNPPITRGGPIIVHPGSGGLRKVWPLKNWWAVLAILCQRHAGDVYVSLGPADERLRSFAEEAEKLGAVTLEGFSLPYLAALLAEARLFIGSDSGVSHLAAAVGIPSMVVFGPTDPGVWAPRGSDVQVLRESWDESEVLSWTPSDTGTSPPARLLEFVIQGLRKPETTVRG